MLDVRDIFEPLNGSDAALGPAPEDAPPEEIARRRVLGWLGRYAAAVIEPLNMRPRAAALHYEDAERVEVRVAGPAANVLVVIAPNGDLAAEVFYLRAMALANLPAPRLLAHDLSRAALPFTYAVLGYIGGTRLDQIDDETVLRVAARQAGRTLRRAHQAAAPGFGRPAANGRWPAQSWPEALDGWLAQVGARAYIAAALGDEAVDLLRAATIEREELACAEPRLLHGAVAPERALASVAESAQLEALDRPGALVGGDPLFDLALGLLPRYPAAFREGLLAGYTARLPLEPAQQVRLARLGLLVRAVDAARRADDDALEAVFDDLLERANAG